MHFKIAKAQPLQISTALLVVGCFEGELHNTQAPVHAFNESTGGALLRQAKLEGFTGASGQTLVHFSDGKLQAKRVLLVGLGSAHKSNLESLRKALTAVFHKAKALKVTDITVTDLRPAGGEVTAFQFGEAVASYAGMIDYVINHAKTAKAGHKKEVRINRVQASVVFNQEQVLSGMEAGAAIARAVNKARDLTNMPAGDLTPRRLAVYAQRLARQFPGAIECKVFGRRELEKMGAGALLAVARGSNQEPVLIELTYTPPGGATSEVLGFVGKSITFDSGGLDIKTADGMRTMKRDMAGGASVLAAIGAVAALKLPISVKAFMAATENMVDAKSYKPGDVLVTMSGLTVEVDNTDAEGRLSLADAIEYARRQGVTRIIDLATLTGAIRSYGGDVGAGAFGNTPEYTARVLAAAESAGERLGELPMWPELRSANHTDMADLKNSGGDPGSVTAAWFIREFAGETPWVHLDIAGCSYRNRELGPDPKGATGYGVRTLVELARIYCK